LQQAHTHFQNVKIKLQNRWQFGSACIKSIGIDVKAGHIQKTPWKILIHVCIYWMSTKGKKDKQHPTHAIVAA